MPFLHPTYIIAILVAIAVHEWAHAWSAHLLGDDTAKWEGRLTLNPLAHIDPLGALLFLTVGFGWAKPVPVNPLHLKRPKRDMAIVALAGPVSNLVLAFLAYAALVLLYGDHPAAFGDVVTGLLGEESVGERMLELILLSSVMVNLGLMAFNLLPVPPLDGSNILRMFIPWRMEARYMEWMRRAPMLLLGVLVLESFTNVQILSGFVSVIVSASLSLFALLL